MGEQVFPMIPATGNAAYWIMIPVFLLMLGGMLLVGFSLRAAKNTEFILAGGSLQIKGDIYARKIPAEKIRWSEARKVDLQNEPALKPSYKTVGTAMPGYNAGWFRLKNGSKALLALTDKSSVVYIPTTEDYSILLSVADPEAFLAAARR